MSQTEKTETCSSSAVAPPDYAELDHTSPKPKQDDDFSAVGMFFGLGIFGLTPWTLINSYLFWIYLRTPNAWQLLPLTSVIFYTSILLFGYMAVAMRLTAEGWHKPQKAKSERLEGCACKNNDHCPLDFGPPFRPTSKSDVFWMFVVPICLVVGLTVGTVLLWKYNASRHDSILEDKWRLMLSVCLTIVTTSFDFGFLISIFVLWQSDAGVVLPFMLLQQISTVLSWYWHINNQYPTPTYGETLFFAIYETIISTALSVWFIVTAVRGTHEMISSTNVTTAEQRSDDSRTDCDV